MGREPSCVLNHDAMRRELRDKGMPSQVCPECHWILRAAELAEITEIDHDVAYQHVLTCEECYARLIRHNTSNAGSTISAAKSEAARMNGRKGGRPVGSRNK